MFEVFFPLFVIDFYSMQVNLALLVIQLMSRQEIKYYVQISVIEN